MRYQNWDVLVFPERSKIPLQEYKTACHVVHDPETLNQRHNVLLLPTVTSFIQALPAGEPFRISIHSWEDPEPSCYTRNVIKQSDLIMFEARVLVDGRLVGAQLFGREGPWPTLIETSLQMNKNGEMESLKFPVFHSEMLTQSYWNAGDELGRIKVVIAEGCSRDPLSTTLDRIKNVVAFSFQHAPLEVLEASTIAWPNAAMWRQVSFNASYLPQYVSPRNIGTTSVEDHSHSPRPRTSLVRQALPPNLGPMLPSGLPMFSRATASDPFTEPMHPWRHSSSADVSMPDYSSSTSWASHSRRVTDPMMTDRPERRYDTMQSLGAFESICEALLPSAPDNTPQDSATMEQPNNASDRQNTPSLEEDYFPIKYEESHLNSMPMLTSSLASIKGRKENVQDYLGKSEVLGAIDKFRRTAQPSISTTIGGAKRQRVVTPAAFKVIDEEDEPRSSPSRKISQVGPALEGERKVLSGIELNIH